MSDLASLKSSLSVAAAFTMGGAGLGTLFGGSLGILAPGYYRSVFEDGSEPSFNPLSVGIGLGLTQGALAGVLIAGIYLGKNRWVREKGTSVIETKPRMWPLWTTIVALALYIVAQNLSASPPRIAWENGKLYLWNFGLRDVMITHLASGELTAHLPQPLLLRSHIENATVDPKRLVWQDPSGAVQPTPDLGEPIGAIYVEARLSPPTPVVR